MRIIYLGSSITYGSAAEGYSFADALGEMGHPYVKIAVSGTTLAKKANADGTSYVERFESYCRSTTVQAELLCIQLSTNDASQNLPLGAFTAEEKKDTATALGALDYLICRGKQMGLKIAVFTNPPYPSKAYAQLVEGFLQGARAYHPDVAVLDMWNMPSCKLSAEARARYMADDIHPTRLGYTEWWAPLFLRLTEQIG